MTNRILTASMFALLTVAAPVHAATIQWNLSGVVPPETVGVTVTGSFDFNTTSPCCSPSTFPNYDLTLTSNGKTVFKLHPVQ
jgi:hypothetical protein